MRCHRFGAVQLEFWDPTALLHSSNSAEKRKCRERASPPSNAGRPRGRGADLRVVRRCLKHGESIPFLIDARGIRKLAHKIIISLPPIDTIPGGPRSCK